MRPRPFLAGLISSLLLLPGQGNTQTSDADVTFELPLNLTGLSSALGKVAVRCQIESTAFRPSPSATNQTAHRGRWGQAEFFVTQGQVVQTAQVVVAIQANDLTQPAGKLATFECRLKGYDAAVHRWQDLHSASLGPAFQILPSPAPVTGSFWW